MPEFTFDIGLEVEHVAVTVYAQDEETARRTLSRMMPLFSVEDIRGGQVVDSWVNTVEEVK